MSWIMNEQGLEIFYEVMGHGTPLLFQSGYMGIHNIWNYVVENLKEKYMCITHDNRGYGLSSKPESTSFYTMEANANDLMTVINAAGVKEPVIIVTHSIGSLIAQSFAALYPEMVKGIIMLGGATMSGALKSNRNGSEEMWSAYQTTPSASMQFYRNFGLCEEIALEAAKWNHNAFTKQARAVLNFELSEDEIKRITQPITVVQSKSDFVTPMNQPQEIVDRYQNAKLVVIDGCIHFPPTELPDVCSGLICEFAKEFE